jgi:threonine dehydrogenase-like Zn-dependent dehydrogenase
MSGELTIDAARALAAADWLRRGDQVLVLGAGAGAELLRSSFDAPGPDRAPEVVVETTGAAASIAHALSLAADLGTVVLAGTPDGPIELDAYPDIHVRGLTVIAWPPEAGAR